MPDWTIAKSAELYGIEHWGREYFSTAPDGTVAVRLRNGEGYQKISLHRIVQELHQRGIPAPVLLRFPDLLGDQIRFLNTSFQNAIFSLGYKGNYRGVFPIKVNQQRQAIEAVTEHGKPFQYGLEAGSKPELIAALAYLHDPQAFLICNGYKDAEFIDLALSARKMGLQSIIVLEMPGELPLVLERARLHNIRPIIGVRLRLASRSGGHWSESGGDRSVFGLSIGQVIEAVDQLSAEGYLDCLQMVHYHQGSQLPNIKDIRDAVAEASRVYVELAKEGAPLHIFDLGGGLAIDYDGTQTSSPSSCNYGIPEYCADVVEIVQAACDEANIPHPTLVTESGRAVAAHASVLCFNILDVNRFRTPELPPPPNPDAPRVLADLHELAGIVSDKNLHESYNDAIYYRDQLRAAFRHGDLTLRQRAAGETLFWHICTLIHHQLGSLDFVPEDLQELNTKLIDFYYGNFSVFQSLPDTWAIDQLFPVMPLHRLDERPEHNAVISDITCDCDGMVDRFPDLHEVRRALPLHDLKPDEEYYLGVFLVGAYQETLGDLHNLLGDTHAVSVTIVDGQLTFSHEVEGDTVEDVLSYVEFNGKQLVARFTEFAERAVRQGLITAAERREIVNSYRSGLDGYTYFES